MPTNFPLTTSKATTSFSHSPFLIAPQMKSSVALVGVACISLGMSNAQELTTRGRNGRDYGGGYGGGYDDGYGSRGGGYDDGYGGGYENSYDNGYASRGGGGTSRGSVRRGGLSCVGQCNRAHTGTGCGCDLDCGRSTSYTLTHARTPSTFAHVLDAHAGLATAAAIT
jgi:hypothetical protein